MKSEIKIGHLGVPLNLIMKTRLCALFHSCANKTNFHMKISALSFAIVMWFKATRKWPIDKQCQKNSSVYFVSVDRQVRYAIT